MAAGESHVATTVPTTGGWSSVPFAGAAVAPAPLTWGQRALWIAIRRHGPGQTMISLRRTLAVPKRAAAEVDSVCAAIGALLSRHSSLRTRLVMVDEQRCQVVTAAGEMPVLLVAAGADAAATADEVAQNLAAVPFEHESDWPQRLALIVAGDRVQRIVVVFSHTTVDFQAAEIVLRDLRMLLLRGTIAAAPGLQSVDIARRETGEHHRRGERSVAAWVDGFGRLPTETVPAAGAPSQPRFQRALLVSGAADTATRLIAAHHRVTSSTVLLAATAAVLGSWTANAVVGVFTMSNNRSLDGYPDAIAKLNQLGLVVVDLADRPSFAAMLPRVWQAALDGYRHSYYDPTRMAEAFAAAGFPYATGVSPHCYLNDIRLSTDIDLFGRDTGEDAVRTALASSTVSFTGGFEHFTWRTRVEILDMPHALGLALTADTSHVPPESARRFLRDLERLLVEAAFRDVPWPWTDANAR